MDEKSFMKELSKYKQVRGIDYVGSIIKAPAGSASSSATKKAEKQKAGNNQSAASSSSSSSASTSSSAPASKAAPVTGEAGFWQAFGFFVKENIQSSNIADSQKFLIAAMKVSCLCIY